MHKYSLPSALYRVRAERLIPKRSAKVSSRDTRRPGDRTSESEKLENPWSRPSGLTASGPMPLASLILYLLLQMQQRRADDDLCSLAKVQRR